MDSKNPFDTSFIPQQPVIKVDATLVRRGETNIAMIVSLVLLFATLAAAGGMYFWKVSINKDIEEKEVQLAQKESQINIEAIKELERVEARLTTGKKLLENHEAFTLFFDFLESETLQSVGFTKLEYVIKDKKALVNITGEAPNYMSVYVQKENMRASDMVANVRMGRVSLSPASGVVSFEMEIELAPRAINFNDFVKKQLSNPEATTTPTVKDLPSASTTPS